MGDGAFSNVYKAIDKLSGQKVAGEFVNSRHLGAITDVPDSPCSQSRPQVRVEPFTGKRLPQPFLLPFSVGTIQVGSSLYGTMAL
jgi:serine/threonine protein kinase